ncbi:MAG: hypothetical protein ACRDGV_08430 [Candidatus Limnocylindria bacterium]
MATAPPAPPAQLDVRLLRRLATSFDEISDETGARYSARAFVGFVTRELAGRAAMQNGVHRELHQVGARSRWAG